MRHVILAVAVLGIFASGAMAAIDFTVNMTATAPTGPNDPIWNTAVKYSVTDKSNPNNWVSDDSGTPNAAAWPTGFSVTQAMLWDSTKLYECVWVTDATHVATSSNGWENDGVEFYNKMLGRSGKDKSQNTIGLRSDGTVFNLGNNDIALPNGNVVGTFTNPNYAVQVTFEWLGTGGGQLGYSSVPLMTDAIPVLVSVNDVDSGIARVGRARIPGDNTGIDQWTLGALPTAQLTPEPATMALLGLGAVGMLLRRRRR